MTPRKWTIRFAQPADQMNLNDREHWGRHHKAVKAWRQAAWAAVSGYPRPMPDCRDTASANLKVRRALVHVDLPAKNAGQRRDPSNWAPTVKAIVDGLVDGGIWLDDNSAHVVTDEPTFTVIERTPAAPGKGAKSRLGPAYVTVTITELAELPTEHEEPTVATSTIEPAHVEEFDTEQIVHIPLDRIVRNPHNRTDLGDLTALAGTIAAGGVREPAIVVVHGDGWQLVAGERRLEASRLAGAETLPCIVRDYNTTQQIETMAIENLQRLDLTPFDEGRNYQLLADLGYSQRDIAATCGVGQATVSKRLSLMKLPDTARGWLAAGRLTVRQAEHIAEADEADIDTVVAKVEDSMRHWSADVEIRDTAIEGAIATVVTKHKKAKAIDDAIKTGKTRLDPADDPRRAPKKWATCKKAEASHWWISPYPSEAKVWWARTAEADKTARAATPAPTVAGTETKPAKKEEAWQRTQRLAAAADERVDRALDVIANILAYSAHDDRDDLADQLNRWFTSYAVDLIADGEDVVLNIGRIDPVLRADISDRPADYIALAGLVGAIPNWNLTRWNFAGAEFAAQLLVDHGYRPGEDETLPDTITIPPGSDDRHVVLFAEQEAWELANPKAFGKSPWKGFTTDDWTVVVAKLITVDDDVDTLHAFWGYERHRGTKLLGAGRLDVEHAIADRIWVLTPFANRTIDQPQTTWEEPELQPAADVPPAASCSSCSRPATTEHPMTGDPFCDACLEATEAGDQSALDASIDEAAEWEASAHAPGSAAEARARGEQRAAEASAQAVPALQSMIDAEDDPRRKQVLQGQLDHLRRSRAAQEPAAGADDDDDVDVDPVAELMGPSRMRHDDGTAILAPDTEQIAVNERAGVIPPDQPWSSYDAAGKSKNPAERILKTLGQFTKLAVIDQALTYETWPRPAGYEGLAGLNRADIVGGITARRAELEATS